MRIAHGAVGRDHQHAAELGGVAHDSPLMHGNAALCEPRAEGGHEPARHLAWTDQLGQGGDLRAGPFVAGAPGVHQQRDVHTLDAAELRRLGRRALTNPGEAYSAGLEFVTGAVQLHRVLAAEHSAVVAKEDKRHGPVPPEVTQPYGPVLVIAQHDVLELARVLWRPRALPFPHRVEHCAKSNPAVVRSRRPEGRSRLGRFSAGRGDGTGLSDAVAVEVEALLAASERAAETIRADARREARAAIAPLVEELRAAADRLEETLARLGDAPRAPRRGRVVPRGGRDDAELVRRGELIALNMAVNGAPRNEADRYLSENLGLKDRDSVLDAVYAPLPG
jgi:hypothetical protein